MDHILKTIEDVKADIVPLEAQIAPIMAQIAEKKRLVNQLCGLAKIQAAYSDSELSVSSSGEPTIKIRPDQFFNQPLARVAREYLEMRKSANLGLASIEEMYEALKNGGFVFIGNTEDIRKNGLAISLGKNATVFVKVSGKWGLASWYGINKRPRRDGAGNGNGADTEKPEDTSGGSNPAENNEMLKMSDFEPKQ